MTIQQAFALALRHQQAGAAEQAEQICRQILAREPAHGDALHMLGLLALQAGRGPTAADLLRRAVDANPGAPEWHNDLGVALRRAGQVEQAVAAHRQAIALRPDMPEAHSLLGIALSANGQREGAIGAFRQAIALKPDFAEAYANLGVALRDQGLPDEAVAAGRRAVALRPDYPTALYNLGNALKDKGELEEAILAYRRAVALNPGLLEAYSNLGNALNDKGRHDEAIAAFRQAIALNPQLPDTHNNLGAALRSKGQFPEALAALRQALAQQPNYPPAHNNIGNVLCDQGQLQEAVKAYRQAIALNPGFAEAHSNLGNALRDLGELDEALDACQRAIALQPGLFDAHTILGNILKERGQIDEAIAVYRRALAVKPDDVAAHDNLVLATHYHPGCDGQRIAEELGRWNRQHAEPLKKFIRPHPHDRSPDRRLRIGYVSADFGRHPVGRFMLPLLSHHDRKQVEVFAYAQVKAPDTMTELLRTHTDAWRSIVGLADSQVDALIRQDRIDILVDLALHTAGNRLLVFARKPAPVQVTYLAYAGSSGIPAMDCRLTDEHLDPPEKDAGRYCERSIYLPGTYWCYPGNPAAPTARALPAEQAGHVTFGCLNNFCKVNEGTLGVWCQILHRVAASRLHIHALEGQHRARVRGFFEQRGIDPGRIAFIGRLPRDEYFAQYLQVDVTLDTFPFGGGTTTCDALWMGAPVVSLAGSTAVGRAGLSILSNVGLPELVAHSEQEYVRIAVELSADWPRLRRLRSTLRKLMEQSPLMDAARFARDIETAYRRMWKSWCAGHGSA